MYIITEDTPNPNVKKFIPHVMITGDNTTYEFNSAEEALESPLAHRLFELSYGLLIKNRATKMTTY